MIVNDPAQRKSVGSGDSVSHHSARALDSSPRRPVIEAALGMDGFGRASTIRPIVEYAPQCRRERIPRILLGAEPDLPRLGNPHRDERGKPLLDEREML